MSEAMSSVSIRGDRDYLRAVKALANFKDMKIGDLIRESVDAKHGEELQRYLDFFCAEGEDKNPRLRTIVPQPADNLIKHSA